MSDDDVVHLPAEPILGTDLTGYLAGERVDQDGWRVPAVVLQVAPGLTMIYELWCSSRHRSGGATEPCPVAYRPGDWWAAVVWGNPPAPRDAEEVRLWFCQAYSEGGYVWMPTNVGSDKRREWVWRALGWWSWAETHRLKVQAQQEAAQAAAREQARVRREAAERARKEEAVSRSAAEEASRQYLVRRERVLARLRSEERMRRGSLSICTHQDRQARYAGSTGDTTSYVVQDPEIDDDIDPWTKLYYEGMSR